MCGICGKLIFDPEARVSPALLQSMAGTMAHRGPDDAGVYVSENVGLGFRRLSIIDLEGGHQPLCNEDGTVWIVFNGEIYNHRELRDGLLRRGHFFRTQSDTEVIVHLYEELGEQCVEKLRGMFGFAIWDRRSRSLFLARDRVGIKPLYYWRSSQALIFASEIKAILADREVAAEMDPAALDRFFTFGYVPGESTLFRNIRKLRPGTTLRLSEGRAQYRQYWDLCFEPAPINPRQAQTRLVELLDEAVRLHMISDVPVGFLLSGGVDSTAMLSFAREKTDRPISSYTIGFSDLQVVDERPYARLAASRYGSEHHEMSIEARDFAVFLPEYVFHMEEPVCEPPAVALYYVSRLARNFVKVLISGEGGDEAFAGYSTYRNLLWLERAKKMLHPLRGLLARSIAVAVWPKIAKYAPLFKAPLQDYYLSRSATPPGYFHTHWQQLYSPGFLDHVERLHSESVVRQMHDRTANGRLDAVNRMLYIDSKTWLPDDLLIKADKMTMANSIELRVPFLDHQVLEFAATLPASLKVRGFTTKYIAKKALAGRLPPEIVNRKKTGFPVPYARWLRSDLDKWVRSVLLDPKTLERNLFNKTTIQKLLADNSRSGAFSKEIFSLLILELWHRCFIDRSTVAAPPIELDILPESVSLESSVI